MHDELFKQGNCRRGVGEGEGWSFDVSGHNHISHELSSEANHGFEGYSDCERAGQVELKVHVRIFLKLIICEYLEADD